MSTNLSTYLLHMKTRRRTEFAMTIEEASFKTLNIIISALINTNNIITQLTYWIWIWIEYTDDFTCHKHHGCPKNPESKMEAGIFERMIRLDGSQWSGVHILQEERSTFTLNSCEWSEAVEANGWMSRRNFRHRERSLLCSCSHQMIRIYLVIL